MPEPAEPTPASLTPPRRHALAAWVAVVVVSALLMIPSLDAPGAEVDEGLLVAFPAQMLHGRLPQGDFYYPYGPGSVWIVAGADAVFGTNLGTERAVGMAYRLAIVSGAFTLALSWGLAAATLAAAIVAAPLVGSLGANASIGFLALTMLGYALLARSLLSPTRRSQKFFLPLAGALLGATALMRYDFLPAVVLAALPLVLILSPRERWRFGAGAAAGIAPLAIHLALVGPAPFWRSTRIAFEGRTHPARPPFVSDLTELIAIYVLATALLLAAGWLVERRARRDPEARVLLGSGLWGVGLLPFALSHLDAAHVIVASLPVLAMLPVAVTVVVRGDLLRRPAPAAARSFALGAVLTAIFLTAASAFRFPVYHQAKYLLTGKRDPAFVVSNRGRSFRLADSQAARDVQATLTAIDRIARPGQSVFVGPQDLRTAGANDVFLYFLLDQLKPASYFVEVDPHTINRARNGFTSELARADFAVLTTRLTHTPLTDVGSPTANAILARRFCIRAARGTYRLYERCR